MCALRVGCWVLWLTGSVMLFVPPVGLEPTSLAAADFESAVYTNSTKGAYVFIVSHVVMFCQVWCVGFIACFMVVFDCLHVCDIFVVDFC